MRHNLQEYRTLALLALIGGAYIGTFVALVHAGREDEWPRPGFRFSENEHRDRALGRIFKPLTLVAHLAGWERLAPPFKNL